MCLNFFIHTSLVMETRRRDLFHVINALLGLTTIFPREFLAITDG